MTLLEAQAIAHVLTEGMCEGCHVCMERQTVNMRVLFPMFTWTFTHGKRGSQVTVNER